MAKNRNKFITQNPGNGTLAGEVAEEAGTPSKDAPDVVQGDLFAEKKVGGDSSSVIVPAHPHNARRSQRAFQLFAVAMITALGTGAIVAVWAKTMVEKRVAEVVQMVGKIQHPAPSGDDTDRLAKLDEQIVALQKQVDTWRREQLLSQKDLRESIERVAQSVQNGVQQTLVPLPSNRAADSRDRMPDMAINVTPTQKEFIQLKERNRLTAYADEAIATGLRKPLETLVEYLRDPESEHLHHAVQAEYMRAIRAVQTLQREDPGYRLPVAELFKDGGVRNEADLKPAALFKLLDDIKQPWEIRLRAAILLKGSDAPETNEKLIRVIKEDPSLDVAKHAQICLEQRIGRRFRMFDIPAIDAWWKSQGNG